jgi:hypothetical protein
VCVHLYILNEGLRWRFACLFQWGRRPIQSTQPEDGHRIYPPTINLRMTQYDRPIKKLWQQEDTTTGARNSLDAFKQATLGLQYSRDVLYFLSSPHCRNRFYGMMSILAE